jgi:hypothetical protein
MRTAQEANTDKVRKIGKRLGVQNGAETHVHLPDRLHLNGSFCPRYFRSSDLGLWVILVKYEIGQAKTRMITWASFRKFLLVADGVVAK